MNSQTAAPPKGNILIVDDKQANLRLLSEALNEQGYKVRCVINGQRCLKAVRTIPPDLILLDIMMPEMDGYEVCQKLKADREIREIPVIFLSALDEVIDKVRAFEVGGVDYITKPFQLEEVLVRVENQLALQSAKAEIRRLNAELEQRVCQRTAQLQGRTEQLETANRALEREINDHRQTQKQLQHMALHDGLTSLPNRILFTNRLEQAINRTKRRSNYLFAVLFLDCDRFKVVNDSLGHLVGDQLLIAVARRLESCLCPVDTIARLGGDEFAILLEELEDLNDAASVAERLNQELALPFCIDKREIFINASIGIVLGTKDYQQPEALLRDADTAMYRAKELGKARYQVFDRGMHDCAQKILQLETDLQLAMARNEFTVHYQPIVSLATGKIIEFEALLRWHHPKRGLISPAEFIPLAEESGLIVPIGMWVLREACRQASAWHNQDRSLTQLPLKIGVNLSVKQFSQPDLIEQLDQILAETQLDGRSLTLEITDSAIMDNGEVATKLLQKLRARRIQLSIDDFGTGYSSLSYLHRFPVDTLKIDRSFISRICENGKNQEVVRAIVTLAHHLGMTVIAEGVETAQQFDLLRKMGCELGQGYFFSKPLEQESAGAILEQFSVEWNTPVNGGLGTGQFSSRVATALVTPKTNKLCISSGASNC